VTSPGQKDTHTKWERQEELGRDSTAVATKEEPVKALQIKRWTAQEGPFQGFNSPPGRF
jgi:hypothetical protein